MSKTAACGLPIQALDVVLVDDNESMLNILRAVFNAFEVESVRAFTSAERALKSSAERTPHLIVTDWRMRPVDGLTLVRSVRHRETAPLCFAAIMVVSGHASKEHVSCALLAGASQFLVKPVSPSTILERVKWVCRDTRELVLEDDHYAIAGVREAIARARGLPAATPAGEIMGPRRKVVVSS